MSDPFANLLALERTQVTKPNRRFKMSGNNIFDNMGDEEQEFSPTQPRAEGGSFTVQFGTEDVQVVLRPGMSVQDAFTVNSDFLGFDPTRTLAYRDNHNNLLQGTESPEPNTVYTASITYDEKG